MQLRRASCTGHRACGSHSQLLPASPWAWGWWLCLWLLSPSSTSLRPLPPSLAPSLPPSQSSRENFAWRLLKPLIKSGQGKLLATQAPNPEALLMVSEKQRRERSPSAQGARRASSPPASRREREVQRPPWRPGWWPGTQNMWLPALNNHSPPAEQEEPQKLLLPLPPPWPGLRAGHSWLVTWGTKPLHSGAPCAKFSKSPF